MKKMTLILGLAVCLGPLGGCAAINQVEEDPLWLGWYAVLGPAAPAWVAATEWENPRPSLEFLGILEPVPKRRKGGYLKGPRRNNLPIGRDYGQFTKAKTPARVHRPYSDGF